MLITCAAGPKVGGVLLLYRTEITFNTALTRLENGVNFNRDKCKVARVPPSPGTVHVLSKRLQDPPCEDHSVTMTRKCPVNHTMRGRW